MRAPEFWHRPGIPVAELFTPLSWLWTLGARLRRALAQPWIAPVPVICIGNLVAGGAGKTPVALDLGSRLARAGRAVRFATRGHGGSLAGPVKVDVLRHTAAEVGDEALLLAEVAPVWVARNRLAGVEAAAHDGAEVVIMDDGFQNPSVAKTLSFLVIDGGYGLGNGLIMPAGPLRESLAEGLARAQAVVLIGEDEHGLLDRLAGATVLRADLVPGPEADELRGRPVLAFAGIGRPQKFFATLERIGARVVGARAFGDHHPYDAADMDRLRREARGLGARLVTTAKDAARLAPEWRSDIAVLNVRLVWRDEAALMRALAFLGVVTPAEA